MFLLFLFIYGTLFYFLMFFLTTTKKFNISLYKRHKLATPPHNFNNYFDSCQRTQCCQVKPIIRNCYLNFRGNVFLVNRNLFIIFIYLHFLYIYNCSKKNTYKDNKSKYHFNYNEISNKLLFNMSNCINVNFDVTFMYSKQIF